MGGDLIWRLLFGRDHNNTLLAKPKPVRIRNPNES